MRVIPVLLALGAVIPMVAIAQFQFYGTSQGPQFRTFAQGQQSNATGFRTEVLNTDGDLQRYWSRVVGQRPESAPRDVKWGEEMLIAINLGQRSSLGYSVYVETIAKRRGELLVSVVEQKPAPGSMVGQAITSPWVIVRMNRQPEPLVFQRREQTARFTETRRPAACGCTCGCPACARGRGHEDGYDRDPRRWGGG